MAVVVWLCVHLIQHCTVRLCVHRYACYCGWRHCTVQFNSVTFKVAQVSNVTTRTTEGVNRDVKAKYQDMISGRGMSSVDAERLAVTAPLQGLKQLVPYPWSRNLKGPATDGGMLEGWDHQASGAGWPQSPLTAREDQLHGQKVQDMTVPWHTELCMTVAQGTAKVEAAPLPHSADTEGGWRNDDALRSLQ